MPTTDTTTEVLAYEAPRGGRTLWVQLQGGRVRAWTTSRTSGWSGYHTGVIQRHIDGGAARRPEQDAAAPPMGRVSQQSNRGGNY